MNSVSNDAPLIPAGSSSFVTAADLPAIPKIPAAHQAEVYQAKDTQKKRRVVVISPTNKEAQAIKNKFLKEINFISLDNLLEIPRMPQVVQTLDIAEIDELASIVTEKK